jgi:hypothetical protein
MSKYPGILVTPETYNLFSSIERANMLRKEEAWKKGKPFYRAKIRIEKEDGTEEYRWVERLVNEYAHLFNNIKQTEERNEELAKIEWDTDSPPQANLGGDINGGNAETASENNTGETSGEV